MTGRIEQIDMKNTILRTFDFKRVVIPNSKFVRAVIKTYSLENVLKLEITIKIDVAIDIEAFIDKAVQKVNTYEFVMYKEYTQVLIQNFDQKTCEIKVSFCFNPNAGLPTDLMKSKVQA